MFLNFFPGFGSFCDLDDLLKKSFVDFDSFTDFADFDPFASFPVPCFVFFVPLDVFVPKLSIVAFIDFVLFPPSTMPFPILPPPPPLADFGLKSTVLMLKELDFPALLENLFPLVFVTFRPLFSC